MTVTVYPRRGDLPPAVVVGEYAAEGEPDLVIEVYGDGEDRVARAIAEMLRGQAWLDRLMEGGQGDSGGR